MTSPEVTLYSYWRSSCSWRVRIGLNLKKIPYTVIPVHLVKNGGEQHAPSFTALNPSAQVPVLAIDGLHLSESVAILEYLEETRAQPPLLPAAAAVRAQVRMIVEMVNAGIQPKQNLAVLVYVAELCGDPQARARFARKWVQQGLRAVEKALESVAGKCCVGDDVTLADLVLVPQMYNAERVGVDGAQFPVISRVMRYLEGLPEFQAAHPSAQPDAEG